MKRMLIFIAFAHLAGCYNHPSIPAACQPDTTFHSSYSFVDTEGNFIDNGLILRIYDASNKLAGYALPDSCVNFNKIKIISDLLLRLKAQNKQLSQKLLRGEISACDTTHTGNHKLVPFIPLEHDTLKRVSYH